MELLIRLTQTDGASGGESNIRKLIQEELEDCCDEIRTDALGNLIARKGKGGAKIMFAAHMDEIGVMVNYIDKNGFVRFSPLGGLYTKDLVGRRAHFENGVIGVIGSEEEEFNKKADIAKLYIDLGARNKEEAQNLVTTGDKGAFVGDIKFQGDCVISKALDNRAGCYILIETLKRIKSSQNELYFVFTTQEEVGLRGAKAAAYSIDPDYAIAVDVTDTGDTPEAPKMAVKIGNGAAIKVMDYSILCDPYVRGLMIDTAKKNNIPYQLEIMADGGTDAGAIHITRAGVKTGGISLPARYIHSPSELASISDITNCIDLCHALARAEWEKI